MMFFQSFTEQTFGPRTKHGDCPSWHLKVTINNQQQTITLTQNNANFTFFSGCLVGSAAPSFLLGAGVLYFSLKMSPSSSSSANRSTLTFSGPTEREGGRYTVKLGARLSTTSLTSSPTLTRPRRPCTFSTKEVIVIIVILKQPTSSKTST